MLTGAGISTASGIPDFRSPGGRWSSYQPVPLPDFLARESAREEYWRYKGETWQVIRDAQPNPAHDALARLGCAGRVDLLVTQNVDGLHERSGFPPDRLVNIHGTDSAVVCIGCGAREPRQTAQRDWEGGRPVPRCPCGGPWKPATISFGQAMPEEEMRRAQAATEACDLMVVVGSSLVVYPAAGFPEYAKQLGARLAILNREPTPLDPIADLVLHREIGPTMSFVVGLN